MTTLDRWFGITDRGSTVEAELRGGLATFFTMAYILVLNPIILTAATDSTGARLNFAEVTTSTALVAGVMTLAMGLVGRYPFAIAAGLGLNGVVAFQLAPEMTWAGAMGIVVIEGIAITALVVTGLREAAFEAIPLALKQAISVGIGLFIAFIGFVDAGFVRRAAAGTVPVGLGVEGRLLGWPTVVFSFGLILTAVLVARRVRGAILIGIVVTTIFAIGLNAIVDVAAQSVDNPTGWGLNVPDFPRDVVDTPEFGLIGDFSLGESFDAVGVIAALLFIFTLMLADFFDTLGTVVGVGAEGRMLDRDGRLPGLQRVLFVDSLAAVAGGAASASSNTTYIESAAGVGDGARTGLANLVTGGLLLLGIFLAPVLSIVPYEAASPALVIVGFLLMTQVTQIDWADYDIAIPAFLTIVLMPFSFSITNGIGAGFISYVAIKLARGRASELHPLLIVIAVAFLAYFGIEVVEDVLGV